MTDTAVVAPGTTEAGGGTTTTTTTQAAPWYGTLAGEELGYLQNRGWDKLPANEVALAAAKAHREAEKLIGVPADKVVRLPKDAADTEGWSEFRTKTGVPADEKGYDFAGVKFSDGTELDPNFTADIAKALHSAGVAKDKAPEIVRAIVALGEKEATASAAEREAAINAQRDTLKINWGSNVEANLVIARNAVAALGVKQEAVDALEGQIGYAAVMEMFRTIGTKIGEDTFVSTGANGGARQVMSVDGAKAQLDALQNDSAWVTKLSNGDSTALREFDNLTRIVAGVGR